LCSHFTDLGQGTAFRYHFEGTTSSPRTDRL
jgi:hypothetical protein